MSKKFTWLLLLTGWGIGNTYKFSYFSQDIRFSVLDTVVFLITLGSLFKYRGKVVQALYRFKLVTTPLLIFIFFGFLSLVLAVTEFSLSSVLIGSTYLFRFIVYTSFFASLIQIFKHEDIIKILRSLGLVTVASCLAQYLYSPDVRLLSMFEWDDHYYRVVGTFLDPGFTGLLLVFILLTFTIKPFRNRFVAILTWATTYLAFALTYSRSSYLAYVFAFAFLSWKKKSWKILICTLTLLVATLPLLPRASDGEGVKLERTNSIQARIDNWKNAITIWRDKPIFGVGFNVYRYAQNKYGYLGESKWLQSHAGAGSDSSVLLTLATTGVVGTFFYLLYLYRLRKLEMVQFFLVPLLIHSVFLNSLFYPAVMLWLALVTAYTIRSVPFESDSQIGLKQ